jgi:preprotein translocase subunit SecE
MWGKIREFFKEVKIELKKVSWPTRFETMDSTKVVIIIVLAIAFYLGVVDIVLSNGVKRILNSSPRASLEITPPSGDFNTVFTFSAMNSYDKEDNVSSLMIRWDFENDGIWDFPPAKGYTKAKTITHKYPKPGDYTIKLQVRDSFGSTNTAYGKVIVRGGGPGGITGGTK